MSTPTGDSSLGGQIPYFLSNFLSKPASALPKGAQWVLHFLGNGYTGSNNTPQLIPTDAIKLGISYEPNVANSWKIQQALDLVTTNEYIETKGCLFVQAVQIPGEGNQVNPEGLMFNGYIRGTIGAGREPYNGMQIVFLETNVSFVDNVIRPWTIATSHLGMIARPGGSNYRCNIAVYKLGVTDQQSPPVILQKYTFYGACPTTIDGEEYNYAVSNTPTNRNTTFTYYYYTLDTIYDGAEFFINNKNPNADSSSSTSPDYGKIKATESMVTHVQPHIQATESMVTHVQPHIQASTPSSDIKHGSLEIQPIAPQGSLVGEILQTISNLIIPFNFFTPPLETFIVAPEIITPNPPPVIVPPTSTVSNTSNTIIADTAVTSTTTPTIQADTVVQPSTISSIQANNKSETTVTPTIIAQNETANLDKLAKQNILNIGVTSSPPVVKPIVLQTISRAQAESQVAVKV